MRPENKQCWNQKIHHKQQQMCPSLENQVQLNTRVGLTCWYKLDDLSAKTTNFPTERDLTSTVEHKTRHDMPSFIGYTILEWVDTWIWLIEELAQQCIKMRSIDTRKQTMLNSKKIYRKPQHICPSLAKQLQLNTKVRLTYSHNLDDLFTN